MQNGKWLVTVVSYSLAGSKCTLQKIGTKILKWENFLANVSEKCVIGNITSLYLQQLSLSLLRELIRLRNNDLFPFVISQHGIFGIRICLMSNLRSPIISRFFSYFLGSYNYSKEPSSYYVRTFGLKGGSENGNSSLIYVLKFPYIFGFVIEKNNFCWKYQQKLFFWFKLRRQIGSKSFISVKCHVK